MEELKRLLQTKINEVETTKIELKQFVEDKMTEKDQLRELWEKKKKELEHLEKKLMD